jgi:Secretion system C-terminal sorting domain/Kelch motif
MKTLLTFSIIMLLTCVAFGQWAATTPMNDSRWGLDAVEHNGSIYVVGGWDGFWSTDRFTGGTWTLLTDMPEGQAGVCAALVGDQIYTFGGYGPLDTVQIFDIYTNSWTTCPADLPMPLYWASAEAVGNIVYVIGGYTVPGGSLNTVYILNTMTNVWTTGASCPVNMEICTTVVHEGYIYAFGVNGDYRYDYSNDSWSAIAARPYLTEGATAEVIDGVIYVMGGNYGYIYYAEPYTQMYDINSNSWTLGPDLIFARYQLTSGYVDGYLYTIGGRDPNGNAQDWVERLYAPTPPPTIELLLWTQSPTIPAGGGILFYGADVTNNSAFLLVRDAWTMVHLPNGNFFGPLMVRNVNLPPGMVHAGNLTQNIPGFAPQGFYTMHGYIGFYATWLINATDTFMFEKLAVVRGDVNDWAASEWEISTDGDLSVTELPLKYSMEAAYPNPFNAFTTISVELPNVADLSVTVHNIAGQQVAELANGQFNAGQHNLTFDASNLASGLYFIQAYVPGELNAVQKVVLTK